MRDRREVRGRTWRHGAAHRVLRCADAVGAARRGASVRCIGAVRSRRRRSATMPWRQLYEDPVLQGLIEKALVHNFDVEIAYTAILEAEARLGITAANQSVFVNGNFQAPYQATAGNKPPGTPDSEFYPQLGIGASYQVDLFGKLASATGAARDRLLSTDAAKNTVSGDGGRAGRKRIFPAPRARRSPENHPASRARPARERSPHETTRRRRRIFGAGSETGGTIALRGHAERAGDPPRDRQNRKRARGVDRRLSARHPAGPATAEASDDAGSTRNGRGQRAAAAPAGHHCSPNMRSPRLPAT